MKRGPYKPQKDIKRKIIAAVLNDEQYEFVYQKSEADGTCISTWIRQLIIKEMKNV
jgi:hypothetical protein